MKICASKNCQRVVDPTKVRGSVCSPCANAKFRYGITSPERDQLLLIQDAKCKLCQRQIQFDGKRSHDSACVDHDHKTNKIRGIICRRCNVMIGYVEASDVKSVDIDSYLAMV